MTDDTIAAKASRAVDEAALRSIFLEARSAKSFLPGPLSRPLLQRVLELTELGPTSSNTLPARFVFVESSDAKQRLEPALSSGNREKTMRAPLTVIVAADLFFYEHFSETFPARPNLSARYGGAENVASTRAFARDNALLQMGYFIIAARALGLDCGPMGGFDRALVDEAFFPDHRLISLYLINLGYADGKQVFPRLPRFRPDEIAWFE
jgi:3-hydroxypropanoate dehydrogenase